MIESLEITIEHLMNSPSEYIPIDVRCSREFAEDHIPGAVSMPLFDNKEFENIGIIYKQQGKNQAIEKGIEFISPKMLDYYRIIKNIKDSSSKKPVLYCARGGSRSKSLMHYFIAAGIPVYRLKKGYKAYRKFVLEFFENMPPYQFIILHGKTGVGKTALLNELCQAGESIIDLEFLAANSGSVFGNLFYQHEPPSQKAFETKLFSAIFQKENQSFWLESESKKIGRRFIPEGFWKQMGRAKHLYIDAPMDQRVDRIVSDYTKLEYPSECLVQAINKLKDSLGGKKVSQYEQAIQKKQYDWVTKDLMEGYYDILYQHSINKYTFDAFFEVETVQKTTLQLIKWKKKEEEGIKNDEDRTYLD